MNIPQWITQFWETSRWTIFGIDSTAPTTPPAAPGSESFTSPTTAAFAGAPEKWTIDIGPIEVTV